MPCYRPLSAYRQLNPETGSRTIIFGREHLKNYDVATPLDLPCGQCIGCRLERSRRWAVRIMHEAQLHPANSFLTLTYNEKSAPKNGSLRLEDVQLFLKRLRRGSVIPLRYFLCGEYGEKTSRPHYHLCLFGEDFSSAHPAESDNKCSGESRTYHSTTPAGDKLYTSERLTETWGLGHALIGDLTFESAAYVARYCLKKAELAGREDSLEQRKTAYSRWLAGRAPEFVTMSRRPGIGAEWFKKYRAEVYPSDSVVMRGREMLPPPAYDRLLEQIDPALFEQVKKQRAQAAAHLADHLDSRSRRLLDRETVKTETIKNTLRRSV